MRGQDHIDSQGLTIELQNFLYARDAQQNPVRDIPSLRCTFGAYNTSFFANDHSSFRWMNLPANLTSALQSRIKNGTWIDRPRFVALGANENFVLITEKHAAVWDLGNYKTVSDLLTFSGRQKNGISEIIGIGLHAYRFGSFVTQLHNGTLTYENMPPHELLGVEAMVSPILNDTKALERQPMTRRDSERQSTIQRKPSSLQQRAQVRREWSERKQHFTAQSKGLKLSLSLSITARGLARLLG
jgi:hypothetical protein